LWGLRHHTPAGALPLDPVGDFHPPNTLGYAPTSVPGDVNDCGYDVACGGYTETRPNIKHLARAHLDVVP